jgi:hypothetical protein
MDRNLAILFLVLLAVSILRTKKYKGSAVLGASMIPSFLEYIVSGYSEYAWYQPPFSHEEIYDSLGIWVGIYFLVLTVEMAIYTRYRQPGGRRRLISDLGKRINLSFLLSFLLASCSLFLVVRLQSVGWSFTQLIVEFGQPRLVAFSQTKSLLLPLTTNLLAASSIVSCLFLGNGKKIFRILSISLIAFSLGLLFTTNSRTLVALPLLAVSWSYLISPSVLLRQKILLATSIALVLFIISEASLSFRATGLNATAVALRSPDVYGYDAPISRFVDIYGLSKESQDHLSIDQLVLAAISNPVPRGIFPEKPDVTSSQFWKNYKPPHITITAFGEIFASSSPLGGFIYCIIYAILLAFAARFIISFPIWRGEPIAFLIACAYTYMALRSVLNLTQFIYIPAFAVLIIFLSTRSLKSLVSWKSQKNILY